MNNKEQYKRLINYASALIIIVVFLEGFRRVWYDYYNENMSDSFWFYGNILMVGIYILMYMFVGSIFSAFRLGYSKFSGLFVSQLLTVICTNAAEFTLISLIGRGRLTATPMLVLTLAEGAFAALWSAVFTHVYHSLYPPRKMIMIYGNQNAKYLVHKMSTRNDKYRICKAMSCDVARTLFITLRIPSGVPWAVFMRTTFMPAKKSLRRNSWSHRKSLMVQTILVFFMLYFLT